jgi:hypothetical protein
MKRNFALLEIKSLERRDILLFPPIASVESQEKAAKKA